MLGCYLLNVNEAARSFFSSFEICAMLAKLDSSMQVHWMWRMDLLLQAVVALSCLCLHNTQHPVYNCSNQALINSIVL